LRCRFLTGKVHGVTAICGQSRCNLQEQCRFTDAWFPSNQQRRARHNSAAGNPIEFRNAGGEPMSFSRRSGQRFKLSRAPFRILDEARKLRPIGFLDQRIPLAAIGALASPALGDGTAVLADE
jgi:hypothetical protein